MLRRFGIVALLVLCAVLVMNEIFGDHGLLALRRQKREVQGLQQQIFELQHENQQLETQIKALKSDPKMIEKQAREELHLARPGETIYMLPQKDSKAQSSPTPDNPRVKR